MGNTLYSLWIGLYRNTFFDDVILVSAASIGVGYCLSNLAIDTGLMLKQNAITLLFIITHISQGHDQGDRGLECQINRFSTNSSMCRIPETWSGHSHPATTPTKM